MTNPSHTELAAQARKAADDLDLFMITREQKIAAQKALLACAAALESPTPPERVQPMQDALESIREHCKVQPSALAAAIVATCDSALAATSPTAPAQAPQAATVGADFESALEAHGITVWGPRAEDFEAGWRAALRASTPAERVPLSDEQIEKLRDATFSINNPFCPVDSKSMRKAVRAAERAHGIVTKESST